MARPGWGGVLWNGWRPNDERFSGSTANNFPHFFPTFPPHAIMPRPSVPTDGRSPRSAGRRKAVSFGGRGPYPWAKSLRSQNPGQRGGLPDRGGSGQGFSREWPEPVAGSAARPFGRPRQGLKPAAFDPRSWSGRAALPGLRRHRERRPETSLPRLTHAGGQRRVLSPKGRTQRNRPGFSVKPRSKESQPAPGRRGKSLAGGARATAPSHVFHATTGQRPAPHKSGFFRTRRLNPNRRRKFSRAGFWRGCETLSRPSGERLRSGGRRPEIDPADRFQRTKA